MARIPAATRENVPQDQVAEFDQLVQGLGGVPLHGPGSIMIHVPKAHQAATALNLYLRNESSLSPAALELSMLLAAREYDCQHIWNAHAAAPPAPPACRTAWWTPYVTALLCRPLPTSRER